MSQSAFDYWAGKHPKQAAGLSWVSRDIDGDRIPEALVEGPGGIRAVNGWQLKPSKARYTQPTWEGRGEAMVARRKEYYDEDLKDIYKQFGELVVKRVFDRIYAKGEAPLAYKKNHEPVINNKTGQHIRRGYSFFTKNVVKVVAGNDLDTTMLREYAEDAERQFPGCMTEEALPDGSWRRDGPRKAAVSKLHKSKEYKQRLRADLTKFVNEPQLGDILVADAIKRAVAVSQGAAAGFVEQAGLEDAKSSVEQQAASGGI
jgi:hypothetical protein